MLLVSSSRNAQSQSQWAVLVPDYGSSTATRRHCDHHCCHSITPRQQQQQHHPHLHRPHDSTVERYTVTTQPPGPRTQISGPSTHGGRTPQEHRQLRSQSQLRSRPQSQSQSLRDGGRLQRSDLSQGCRATWYVATSVSLSPARIVHFPPISPFARHSVTMTSESTGGEIGSRACRRPLLSLSSSTPLPSPGHCDLGISPPHLDDPAAVL